MQCCSQDPVERVRGVPAAVAYPLDCCCCCCVIVSGAGTQCGAHPVSGAESDVDVPSSTRCARGFFPRGVHREPCPGGHPRCVRGQGLCTARRCCVSVTMKCLWGEGGRGEALWGEGSGSLGVHVVGRSLPNPFLTWPDPLHDCSRCIRSSPRPWLFVEMIVSPVAVALVCVRSSYNLGFHALLFGSVYEGFGMPVMEVRTLSFPPPTHHTHCHTHACTHIHTHTYTHMHVRTCTYTHRKYTTLTPQPHTLHSPSSPALCWGGGIVFFGAFHE